jgi:hypothetical protein
MEGLGPFNAIVPGIAAMVALMAANDCYSRGQSIMAVVLVIWYGAAVFVSMQDVFVESPFIWTDGDFPGFLAYVSMSVLPLLVFIHCYQTFPSLANHFLNDMEPFHLIASQWYRVAGGVFLYCYFGLGGERVSIRNGFALQTGILDVFIGMTAIPLSQYVKAKGLAKTRSIVVVWNILGLYDFVSSFPLVFANFLGYYDPDHALSIVTFYPFSLIILYQVPIAIVIHTYMLVYIDKFGTYKDATHKEK